jgi:diguanylate cyclase (GGDEF)-like protein
MVEQPTVRAGRAAPARPRWCARPDARVAALSLSLGVVTLAALLALAAGGVALPVGVTGLWLAALVLLFALTEGFVVHLQVRRGGHAVSLSEVPMMLALLAVDPVLAVLARVAGGTAGLVLLRRQRGGKLAFNIALVGVQAVVAASVFGAFGGTSGELGAREWLAGYAAMLLADVAAGILVTAAISLHADPGEWRRLLGVLRSVPFAAAATTVALLSALTVRHNHWSAVLLVLVSVVLYLTYRAFTRKSQGHARVEGLYAFTSALDGSSSLPELVRIVLDQARDQLRAEYAELLVPAIAGRPAMRVRLSGVDDVSTTEALPTSADAWWAPAHWGQPVLLRRGNGRRVPAPGLPVDGMAVPVSFGDTTGALLVTQSLPDSGTFDEERLRLFHALANHASVSLVRASLVDRLRREAEEKEHQALHDALTGLPNRRQFQDRLGTALEAARHDASGPAVILFDLDRFKEVNDALGHDTGDALLREVGARLRQRTDGRGLVARLGGDEFAVLLPRTRSVQEALTVAADLAGELERAITLGPMSLIARASIGVAVAPYHGDDAQTLLRRADVAMYAAKSGQPSPRVYLPEDDQNTPHRLALIADLREAIERGELLVVFQPKLDPRTGRVVGAEALARWHHPVHGTIPPDQFIPLAEHAGLIRQLTLHVLETSLRRCAAWRRAGHDLHVAVNLSPNSLLDAGLPDLVARLLHRTRNPASALTLEITESSITTDPAGSHAILRRLHALGVQLSIDDFGTGYSSLGRLRELPIHEVKIDRSFVQGVATDRRDRAVVRSAIQLGHALELTVVAEGVEDQDTYAYLTGEGCNVIQGYLVSRPLPPEEFACWLEGRSAADIIRRDRIAA